MSKVIISSLVFALGLCLSGVTAAQGVLSDEEAASATPDALMAEVTIFRNIRQAMTLSISRCESDGICDSAATEDEVQQVINALDARVEGLGQRQAAAGNSAGLADVIIAYADERGGLNRVMKRAGDMSMPVVENIDESDIFGGEGGEAATGDGGGAEQFDDMFSDEDEEL